jgi:CheY-like chemotaxis protein
MVPMHKHQVLLVEPDFDTRSTLLELIEDEGHTVREAASGEEALDYLQSSGKTPCLILLDAVMPGMAVWQVAEKLADDEKLSAIPIVVLAKDQVRRDPRLARYETISWPLRVPRLLELIGLMQERCSGSSSSRAARMS